MARIRTVKPTFFRSLTITELDKSTRLTFIGLWTYADDEGRGVDNARLIKAELWPLDDDYTIKLVDRDMEALASAGLINRYAVGGKRYFCITAWTEHQVINRKSPSSLPDPLEADEESDTAHGGISEDSHREGKGREGIYVTQRRVTLRFPTTSQTSGRSTRSATARSLARATPSARGHASRPRTVRPH